MRRIDKKGFTLIELLAVIVILGVLLAIAVPSVTKYINSSKKSTFITNVKQYADSARSEALDGKYAFPIGNNEATLITFKHIYPKLEKGGQTSSYDGYWFDDSETIDTANSFVLIVNEGTAEDPDYEYYVAARDSKGYGLGSSNDGTYVPAVIEYNQLKNVNVVQLTSGVTYNKSNNSISVMTGITVTKTYSEQ